MSIYTSGRMPVIRTTRADDPNKIKIIYFIGAKSRKAIVSKDMTIDDILQTILRKDYDDTAQYKVWIGDDGEVVSVQDKLSDYCTQADYDAGEVDFAYEKVEYSNTLNVYTIDNPKEPLPIGLEELTEEKLKSALKVNENEVGFLYSETGECFELDRFDNPALLDQVFYFVKVNDNLFEKFSTFQEFFDKIGNTLENRQLLSILSYCDSNDQTKKILLSSIIQHSSFVPLISAAYNLRLKKTKPMLSRKTFATFFSAFPSLFSENPTLERNYFQLFELLYSQFDQTAFKQYKNNFEIHKHTVSIKAINSMPLYDEQIDNPIFDFRNPTFFAYLPNNPDLTNKMSPFIKFKDDAGHEIYALFEGIDPNNKNQFFCKDLLDKTKTIEQPFQRSEMDYISQVTAIYIDVSGSMRLAFIDNDTIIPRYTVAQNIANKLIDNICAAEIYDPILVYYSADEKKITEFPIEINKTHLSKKRTDFCQVFKKIADNLCTGKYETVEKRHIVIISDGIDHHKDRRIDSLKQLYQNKIIVDTIILDKDQSDPFTFSVYTGGVNFHPSTQKQALEIVDNEAFYSLDLRGKAPRPSRIPNEFPNLKSKKYYTQYSQLQSKRNPFYIPSEFGFVSPPSIESLKECNNRTKAILDNIENTKDKCPNIENTKDKYHIYLNKLNDETEIDQSMLQHLCAFIPIGKETPIYCQLFIDFPDPFPYSYPRMRIASNPQYLLEKDANLSNMLTSFGTIKVSWMKGTGKHALQDLLAAIVDMFKDIEFDLNHNEFEDQFQCPVDTISDLFKLNMNIMN